MFPTPWKSQEIENLCFFLPPPSFLRTMCLIHYLMGKEVLKRSKFLPSLWTTQRNHLEQVFLTTSLPFLEVALLSRCYCNMNVFLISFYSILSIGLLSSPQMLLLAEFIVFMFAEPAASSEGFQEIEGESEERRRARLNHHIRTQARMVCSFPSLVLLPFTITSSCFIELF